ncbi:MULTISPECIES: hypothetical protein [Pseudanabaena]|uniref:Uncharacterized protein n=2 Tax=Pseudanabaena TaxID=1152 RepID=L8N2R3_9CYAN|nr:MULTISPECIES: hypothetical protein [Pseudanabaena]ELS33334.1 hypothetical protein Pse7429DRAFT_2333 [Pseudanabaena biceps PCC 7429]MDG3494431.1 hypothetical protein [Pseudanabaena catenata USMAC16]
MNNHFLDIFNKCKKPTVITLKEALKERDKLSESRSNFVTYMAGFSHYEFAESLFDEFGLAFIYNKLIVFDSLYKKIHVKVLINDLIDLPCFKTTEILEIEDEPIIKIDSFDNFIAWRNKDGSYIDNLYQEIKDLNYSQYKKYRKDHLIGINENVCPYEINEDGFTFVIHIVTVPRNIDSNLVAILDKVSNAMFIHDYKDRPDLSICPDLSVYKLQVMKDIHCLLCKVNWTVLEVEGYQEVTKFFDEIKANYKVIPFRGQEYNYFNDFMSNVLTFLKQSINLNLI